MRRFVSFFLALVMLVCSFCSNASFAYSATKEFAQDKLESIQKTTGFIPGKTAVVTGNCYAFASKVCEKLYGVEYSEGLYGNYKCRHESGNYYTVSTMTTGETTSENIEKVISFFVNYAVPGDVIHYGTPTTSSSNSNTHTFIVQSVDNKKLQIYHANYETVEYSRTSCHIDTIYWDSWRSNPSKNAYTSLGEYSLNTFFANRMNKGGVGISINRYTNYSSKYYIVGTTVPDISTIRCSSTGIRVSWNAIQSASKYQVQYKKSSESKYTTATSSCKKTSYDIEDLETGETYNFRVRAYIGTKWMDYSSVDTKKVMPPTISAVTFENTPDGIKMTWGARNEITGVRIYRSATENGTYKRIKTITDNSVSSYVDTSVKYNTDYFYKFERYIIHDGTEYKTTSYAKTAKYVLSEPIISSYRKNATTLCFRVSGDGAQNAFEYYLTDSDGSVVVNTTTATQSTIVISDLKTGEKYNFYCAEKSNIATGEYAQYQMTALPASSSVVGSSIANDGIKIEYNTADDVTGYYIYRSDSKNGTFTKIAQLDSKSISSFVDTTVKYNKPYSYKIRRYLIIDGKIYLSAYSAATEEMNYVLSKPENVTVSRTSPTAVKMKWSKVEFASAYTVQYKAEGGNWVTVAAVSSNSKTISGLSTGKVYYFRVRAENTIGKGSYSAAAEKKVMPPAPAAPTAKLKSNGIRVYWTAKSYATGYKIYRATSKTGKYTLVKTIENKNTSAWSDTSVSYGKGYYYKVVCYVKKGKTVYNSAKSAAVYKKYNLALPKVTVTKNKSTSATVSWKAVEGASKYYVQYKPAGGSWKTVSVTEKSKTIKSLKKNTKYYFRVRAVSALGKGDYSKSIVINY